MYLEHDSNAYFCCKRKVRRFLMQTRREKRIYLQPWSGVRRTADELVKALGGPFVIRLILKVDYNVGDVI